MNLKSVLTKIVDPKFEAIGFRRVKLRDNLVCPYERQQDDRTDIILFQKSQYADEIKIMLNYWHELKGLLNPASISVKDYNIIKPSRRGFIPYKDEEELEAVITGLTDILFERALSWFDAIARPALKQSPEMQRELARDVRSHAERFMSDYGLTFSTDIAQAKQRMLEVEQIVDQNRGKDYETLQGFFIETAAYLGELIIGLHGGAWVFSEAKNYVVQSPNPSRDTTWRPLIKLSGYWNKPEIYSYHLTQSYKNLLWYLERESYD